MALENLGMWAPRKTFSKTKTSTQQKVTKTSVIRLFQAFKNTSLLVKNQVAQRPRTALHMAIIAAVTFSVFVGSSGNAQTSVAGLNATESGYGAVIDETSAANVAAEVASKVNLLVASDVTEQATTLNAQISLPTAGDDYLAKRQVVATAGSDRREVKKYRVENGETISSIAAEFNVTTDTIKWANGLSSDSVRPGQQLTILPVTGVLHTVAAGETAETLAQKYQSNAAQIISFNNAEVDGLKAGQQVVIPEGVKTEVTRPTASTRLAAASRSVSATNLPRIAPRANGYSYGYCTYYVAGRRYVPGGWGDARNWYYNAQFAGYAVGRTPAVGAIAWTPAGYYGHVAYVEQVNGDQVLVSEMNYAGWNRITSRWVHYSSFGGYIY